jgi:hypothetical protein
VKEGSRRRRRRRRKRRKRRGRRGRVEKRNSFFPLANKS